MGMRVYFRHSATVATGITVMQFATSSAGIWRLLEASVTTDSTTGASEELILVRKTAGATVTQGVFGTHLFKLNPTDATPSTITLSTTATGVIATGEGTDGDIIFRKAFNNNNGEWKFAPMSTLGAIIIPPSGILALKFASAPASNAFNINMLFEEYPFAEALP